MDIKWLKREEDFGEKEVEKFQKKLKVEFPSSYLDLIITKKAEYPENDLCFMVSEEERVFDSFFSYCPDYDDNGDSEIEFEYKTTKDDFKEKFGRSNKMKFVPFATDPFGNAICFDYSERKTAPSIVFLDTERLFENDSYCGEKIADSFDDFLSICYEYSEDT